MSIQHDEFCSLFGLGPYMCTCKDIALVRNDAMQQVIDYLSNWSDKTLNDNSLSWIAAARIYASGYTAGKTVQNEKPDGL